MLTAIAAGQDPIMEAALGQMGMTELVNLLSAYASFMSAPLIDAELGSFASDIFIGCAPQKPLIPPCVAPTSNSHLGQEHSPPSEQSYILHAGNLPRKGRSRW